MKLVRRIAALWHRSRETRGLREEMALHLEPRARKFHQAGLARTAMKLAHAASPHYGIAVAKPAGCAKRWHSIWNCARASSTKPGSHRPTWDSRRYARVSEAIAAILQPA